MVQEDNSVWKSPALAKLFVENVRGGIPLAAEQIEVIVRIIGQVRPTLTRVLDLGCGDGILGRAILAVFPAAQATFLDFSEPMLDQARTSCDTNRAGFLLADLASADWIAAAQSARPFDAIVSGFAIHHLADEGKRAVYQGCFDLLAPGGVFLNLEHVAPSSAWAGRTHDELFVDSLFAFSHRVGKTMSRDEVAAQYYNRQDKAANILAHVNDQLDWLRQIGFVDVDCHFKLFELALFGGCKPA
jgi:ubiquinone/menaquinone biosynthesis C-methylase UbiE